MLSEGPAKSNELNIWYEVTEQMVIVWVIMGCRLPSSLHNFVCRDF